MSILDQRNSYRPFEYETAYRYFEDACLSHWLWTKVSMAGDILDWQSMSQTEKNVIAGVLNGFTQSELVVGDYWSNKVNKWFPKPEISSMAVTFSAMEAIHSRSYNNLSESLGLQDYDAFEQDTIVRQRLENLINTPSETVEDIARSLAVFSAFCEGVCLFSSFAILKYFPTQNKLKGVGTIIDYSLKDERQHSEAGCWLFKQLLEEMPNIKPDFDYAQLRKYVYEGAHTVIELESKFIDEIFEGNELDNLNPNDLKEYIKYRINLKLSELGYEPTIEVDIKASNKIRSWFDVSTGGQKQQDFFVQTPTDYTRNALAIDDATLDFSLDF